MSPSGHPPSGSAASADPWLGRVVGGRWKIVSLLDDSGGMASVYLADDVRLPRQAVVKIPKAAHQNAEFAERFAREAFHHAQVQNAHVVNILDRGEEAGTPFLVLQYLSGGNLKTWCTRQASMLADPRLHFESWLLPVAQALDAVAAKGIVHRDVKPTNILFDADGKGYLSDFGIVKAGSEATLTGTGLFIGTLQFMSPEQCDDGTAGSVRDLDGRSDQYGLAVTAYQVLTGWKYPVDGDTIVPIVKAKLGLAPLLPPREHDLRIPQAVNDAVMRALSPDREGRFATSVEFANAVLAGFTRLGERRISVGSEVEAARGGPESPDRPTERPIPGKVDAGSGQADTPSGPLSVVGKPTSAPSGVAWSPVKWLGGGIMLATVAGAAFLLGRGGGRKDGEVEPSRAAKTETTMAGDERDDPIIPSPQGEPPRPAPPSALRDVDVFTNSLGMKLARIPAGEFDMGSTGGNVDEQPVHRVRITKPFLMGQTEVTQGQWQRVMGSTPWKGQSCVTERPNVAATYVSWEEAVTFCERLTERERNAGLLPAGRAYRLPTEAEWEYACRAGTGTTYSFGDEFRELSDYAWWGGSRGNLGRSWTWITDDGRAISGAVIAETPTAVEIIDVSGQRRTIPKKSIEELVPYAGGSAAFAVPGSVSRAQGGGNVPQAAADNFARNVGGRRPNSWNLQDMHGNVREWCGDGYDQAYYKQFVGRTAIDPRGPETGFSVRVSDGTTSWDSDVRVVRGGGWCDPADRCTSAARMGDHSDEGFAGYDSCQTGFRVVVELE